MSKRFILNIVTQMEAGGAQKAATQFCERLIQRGFRSEVWFLYKKRPTYINRSYVRWICEEKPRTIREFLVLFIRLYWWLRQAKPDGLITYTHYANVIGQFVAYLAGIPHRLSTQRNPCWSYPIIARWLDLVLGTVGCYTSNIFVSQSVARSFQSYPTAYNKRSVVVTNGLVKPNVSCNKSEARRKFGLPMDRVIVVNSGRLAYQKNQQLLIEAICGTDNPNWYLVIAGDGELRPFLEQIIRDRNCTDRVKLLGELPPEQIGDLLIASDIFAFPSRFEAFGFAAVEAMMIGLPIIVTDMDVNHEIVGDSGIFLPIDDPKTWQEAIQLLASNENLRQTLGNAAAIQAQQYDLDLMVDNYIKYLFRTP